MKTFVTFKFRNPAVFVAATVVPLLLAASFLVPANAQVPVPPAGVDPALLAKANSGDAASQVQVGEKYAGPGPAQDYKQAAEWYRKAAEEGDPGAQGTLGTLYAYGQGVPRSDADAYYWFDLASAVPGPNQARYAANRQNVGTRITADELSDIRERVAKWKAAHPRPATAN